MMVHICKNLEYNKIIQLHNGLSPHLTHSVISSAGVQEEGPGIQTRHPTPPPYHTWHSFETDIDRIVYYFLPGWFYLMKCAMHFATKLNSWDNTKWHSFLVPSHDLFASAHKAVFFLPDGDECPQIMKHVVISVRSKLSQKSSTVLSEPNFGPPLP